MRLIPSHFSIKIALFDLQIFNDKWKCISIMLVVCTHTLRKPSTQHVCFRCDFNQYKRSFDMHRKFHFFLFFFSFFSVFSSKDLVQIQFSQQKKKLVEWKVWKRKHMKKCTINRKLNDLWQKDGMCSVHSQKRSSNSSSRRISIFCSVRVNTSALFLLFIALEINNDEVSAR